MHPRLILALGLTLAACTPTRGAPTTTPTAVASPAPAGGASDTSEMIAIAVPQSVGDFAFQRRQEFEDPSMGSMIRYENPQGLQADVFVYPGPDLKVRCPTRCARTALKNEVKGFSTVLRGRPDVSRFKVLSARDLVPTAADQWQMGHHLHATVMYAAREGVLQHTDYWIVYFPGFRLKVRSTFVESPERVAALEVFLTQVVPAFTENSRTSESAWRVEPPEHRARRYGAVIE